ncbi:2OG-Fe(II) oxygenase family protein, partial [Luminiphilus sp.]|nr:2OG-Fe(II) oxygenase family protein [Luminiphilus sp.]
RLEGGRHRPHFHPEGVVSGTYYLSVPLVDNKGSIYFGVPPFAIPDPLEPLAEVTPEEGLLILFPSYFFHGTRVAALGYRRETLAFDAS